MTTPARITQAIFDFRRVWLTLFTILIVALAAGIPRLELSSDSRAFFGKSNQEFRDILALDETYTQTNSLLLMVAPPEGTAFAPQSLQALREMTEDAWQFPYILRADSPANHMHSFSEGDEVFVEPLLEEEGDITQEAADRFRRLALASEALRNTLLSETGDTYGIAVHLVLPDNTPEYRAEVEDFLAELRSDWAGRYPGWDVAAVGGLLGNSLLARVAIDDVRYLVPLALLSAIVLFALALGSLSAIGALVLVLLSATVGTFGFAGWTNVALTAGTAISPMAVLVLVSTSCIHVMVGAVRAAEIPGQAHPLRKSVRDNLAPVTVSHLTTALGFLCLNFAPSPPLAAMGNIVAFGLVIGLLSVFVLLPALMSQRTPARPGWLMLGSTTMRGCAHWVLRHSRLWIGLFAAGAAIAVIGLFRIGYDDHVLRYFDTRYQLRQDSETIQQRLTGLDSLQFSFEAPAGASVFDPAFLRSVDRFATWLEAQPDVVAVNALPELLKDINRSMNGEDPEAYSIADSQEANAQLLMFYELSLPLGMDLTTSMDMARTKTLVSATLRAPHSDITRAVARDAEAWLAENEPQIATRAAGLAIAFARVSERNNAQMIYGFLTALALISVTLMITLRSARFGLLSLVPNLVPALLAFGLWGMTMRDVNLGSTVVTTMTFGIVVDDTVHFLMHFLRHRTRGETIPAAIESTFAVVGSSILLTSVAMVAGFAIMALSGFSINQHIGMLTATVIVFALLCDLLLLPALLNLTQGNPNDAA